MTRLQVPPENRRPTSKTGPIRNAYGRLTAAQKPGNGVPAYLRWINRGLGRWAAAIAYRLGWSPNGVSAISLVFSLAGMAVLVWGQLAVTSVILAVFLLLIGYALDSADGQLARLTGTSSAKGEWLDHVVDAFRAPAVHLAVAAVLFVSPKVGWKWSVIVAISFSLVTSVWFLAQILAEKLQTNSERRPGIDAPAWVSFIKLYGDVGFLYLILLIAPWPTIFVPIYTVLGALTVGIAAVSMIRKYRSL